MTSVSFTSSRARTRSRTIALFEFDVYKSGHTQKKKSGVIKTGEVGGPRSMGVVPMKHDDDFFEHNSKATEAAGKELAVYVADIEAIDAQMIDLGREKSDVFTIAKAKGYNVKALRKLLAERKRDAAELLEERQVIELYKELLL
jgi:uncharacterized protein (UPF0335 family)